MYAVQCYYICHTIKILIKDVKLLLIIGKVAFISSSELIYRQFRDRARLVGHFAFDQPQLLVIDLEIAKDVMIRAFDHFTDRRSVTLNTDVAVNRLTMSMPTMLRGERWKTLRSVMSPIFTSGKLKSMTGTIDAIAKELADNLDSLAESSQDFLVKETISDFTLEVIASCGFGVQANAFKERENNKFRDMVNDI